MGTETKELPWLVLGLNSETHMVVVAGFAHTKKQARAKSLSRAANHEMPYDCSRVFQFGDSLSSEIEAWLMSRGVPAMERGRIIRRLGRELLSFIE